jgi:hypothetical protein
MTRKVGQLATQCLGYELDAILQLKDAGGALLGRVEAAEEEITKRYQ